MWDFHVPEALYCRFRNGGWNLIDEKGYLSWCFLNRYLTLAPNVVFVIGAVYYLVSSRDKSSSRLWDGSVKTVCV
jgi:hypothetical protein